MYRFIAIPVGQGDAFYLETRNGSVLVDGGRSIDGFPHLFCHYTGRTDVDILVVTHNDADHANGVLGFLKAGMSCKELWLPGRWAQGLDYVLRPWEKVVMLIFEGVEHESDTISRAGKEGPGLEEYSGEESPGLEEYAKKASPGLEEYAKITGKDMYKYMKEAKETRIKEAEALECDDRGWPIQIANLLERAAEEDYEHRNYLSAVVVICEHPPYYYSYCLNCLMHPQRRILVEALIAAARIREIALEAYRLGIRIRWFEYSNKPSGGNKWLYPLNAKETKEIIPISHLIRTVRGISEGVAFLHFLALTVINEESLVLWASDDVCPGVLFTADSNLSGVRLPSANGPIVTAPHHGSEANSAAYAAIARSSIRDPIWVRSDGNFKRRPCRDYLEASGMKFCTLCRNSNRPKQPLMLYAESGKWVPDASMHPCSCV